MPGTGPTTGAAMAHLHDVTEAPRWISTMCSTQTEYFVRAGLIETADLMASELNASFALGYLHLGHVVDGLQDNPHRTGYNPKWGINKNVR